MSRGILLSPEDGGMGSAIPNFRWDAIHPSTTHGDVVGYELQLDDDDNFRSPETSVTVSCTEFLPNWLPGLTFYWRVRPIYSRPWEHRGAWSPGRTFHYVNLPPEVQPIPDMDLPVGKVVTVDLSPFLHDPDDGNEKLTLRAVDEYVLRVDRLGLVFFFQDEVETHLVRFTVGDWMSEVEGELTVHALRYRHPPYIIGLSDQRPPLKVYVDEGSTETYLIRVHDVDSTEFIYRCTGWDGAVAKPDGTVEFRAEHGEVGQFRATIEVEDEGGRTASMDVDIVVENVNDPPDAPIVLSPAYGAVYDPGQIITFRAMVHDDDVDLGQVLKVSFISNVSGVLRTIVTEGAAEFTLADLPPGRHLITVVVTDGRYSASSETVLDVTGTPAPPPVTTRTDEGVDPVLVLLAAASLFTAGYGGGRWQRKRRPGGG